MKKYKKVLKIVLNVFIWIFVIFSLLMTILALAAQSNADGVPSLGGKCFLTVASDSMAPTFERGDLLISDMLSNEEKLSLNVDDVITFYADLDGNGTTELNSHRITAVNYDSNGAVESYTTKGDNPKTNMVEDAPVSWQHVIARWNQVDMIPNVGNFLSFLQTPKGFLVTIVLPLIIFFLYELFVFVKTLMTVKKKKEEEAPKLTAEEEEAIKKKAIEEYLKQQQQQANAPQTVAKDTSAEENSAQETAEEDAPSENE
jgi:signal peptidase